MKPTDDLLSSFDKSWESFSDAWKKARSKTSEKSVHDLRVSTRRLIATLELARALSRRNQIAKLQRRFKQVLKQMGPLRDVQVQLENLSRMRQNGLIGNFKKLLERKEKRKIDNVRDDLKRGVKNRLSKGVTAVRTEFARLSESMGDEKIHSSVARILTVRENEFSKAERRFLKLQPLNEEALHQMRIALKKLRYTVEAAQPVLGPSAKERAREMHALQQLMGDTRDIEILRAGLEKWAKKKGKTIAIVPALDGLQQKRESLLKRIMASSADFEEVVNTEELRPVAEKTRAVGNGTTARHPAKERAHELGPEGR
jgi:CHAD domain-containing protein